MFTDVRWGKFALFRRVTFWNSQAVERKTGNFSHGVQGQECLIQFISGLLPANKTILTVARHVSHSQMIAVDWFLPPSTLHPSEQSGLGPTAAPAHTLFIFLNYFLNTYGDELGITKGPIPEIQPSRAAFDPAVICELKRERRTEKGRRRCRRRCAGGGTDLHAL